MKPYFSSLLIRGGLVSFITAKALISILPLVSIALVVDIVGFDFWVRIATFQVIATFLSIFIDSKWATLTHAEIKKFQSRNEFLTNILIQKMLAYLVVNLLVIAIWIFQKSSFDPILFLSMQPVLTLPFSNGWYWLIVGKPDKYIKFDAAPKVVAGFISLGFLNFTENLSAFFVILSILQVSISKLGYKFAKENFSMQISLKEQLNFAVSKTFQSFYSLLTLPIISLISPLATGIIAANDRIFRFSMTALVPFQQSYISTVQNKKEGIERFWRNLFLQIILLLIFMLGLSSHFVSNILFEGSYRNGYVTIAYIVLGILVIINRGLASLYLVSRLNLKNTILPNIQYRSGFLALALVLPMNNYFGHMGVLMTFILAEFHVSQSYILVLRKSEESWRENE